MPSSMKWGRSLLADVLQQHDIESSDIEAVMAFVESTSFIAGDPMMGTVNLEDIDALGLVFGRCSAGTLEPLVASARFRALLGTTAESILKKLRECDGAFDNEALQGLAAGQVRKAELLPVTDGA